MTRYFAYSDATKKNRPLSSGYDTEAEAMKQAEFLANTYGGVAKVNANYLDAPVKKFSVKRGWH